MELIDVRDTKLPSKHGIHMPDSKLGTLSGECFARFHRIYLLGERTVGERTVDNVDIKRTRQARWGVFPTTPISRERKAMQSIELFPLKNC